jgi:hypothetical protein
MNGPKLPSFTATEVAFGNMEPGQNRTRTATVRNNGSSDLTISAFDIVPQGATPAAAFTITTPPKTTVLAGSTITVPLRCTASDTGSYSAKLRVTSNGTPSVIELPLTASVRLATSVQEDNLVLGQVQVWPNPATSQVVVTVGAPSTLRIISIDGRIMTTIEVESGTTSVPVESLPIGTYQLVIQHGLAVRSMTLEVIR